MSANCGVNNPMPKTRGCRNSSEPTAPQGATDIGTPEHLARRLAEIVTPSTVIVGIGNELRGDDGAGVEIARRLAGDVPWQIFNAQNAPENFLMKIVERKPQSLILVDASDFAAAPGAVRLMEADQVAGQGPSTHGPGISAFLAALRTMHPCHCVVLGIQPQGGDLARPLSEPVSAAVEMVVKGFRHLARQNRS